MSALAPLVMHHINPATLATIGVAAASSAGVVAAVVGSWFTRMEREARAGVPRPDPSTQQVTIPDPGAPDCPIGPGGLRTSG